MYTVEGKKMKVPGRAIAPPDPPIGPGRTWGGPFIKLSQQNDPNSIDGAYPGEIFKCDIQVRYSSEIFK